MRKRQRLRNCPTLADMARAFGPVDTALAQLAKGYILADGATPVCCYDGRPLELAPALAGLAEAWRSVLDHYRIDVDVAPLIRLADALAGGEMIPLELVDDCQALVIALKRAYRRMDVHQVKSLCNTVSIGILLADAPNTERKAA